MPLLFKQIILDAGWLLFLFQGVCLCLIPVIVCFPRGIIVCLLLALAFPLQMVLH